MSGQASVKVGENGHLAHCTGKLSQYIKISNLCKTGV